MHFIIKHVWLASTQPVLIYAVVVLELFIMGYFVTFVLMQSMNSSAIPAQIFIGQDQHV